MISVQHLEQDCVHPITPRLLFTLPNGRRSLPRASHWLRADVRRMAKDGLRRALAAEEHDGAAVSAIRLHPVRVSSVYLRPHPSSGHREGVAPLHPPQLATLEVAQRDSPLEGRVLMSMVVPRTPARHKIRSRISDRVASPSAWIASRVASRSAATCAASARCSGARFLQVVRCI